MDSKGVRNLLDLFQPWIGAIHDLVEGGLLWGPYATAQLVAADL